MGPPCTPVLLTVCRRRSLPWLPPPSRSRSSLLLRGSTPSGSEGPSWPPSPPSSRCGSASRSMTSLAQPSYTGSASNGANFHSRHEEIDLRLKLSLGIKLYHILSMPANTLGLCLRFFLLN